jgi:hypothetical protein
VNFAAVPRKRGRESPLWIDFSEDEANGKKDE